MSFTVKWIPARVPFKSSVAERESVRKTVAECIRSVLTLRRQQVAGHLSYG